ncbi:MAG: PTS sugar transporter subunit IIC [Solidesulfovibrio sp. DCME]|uniref:PTS sugar transporter subunit IIC n=1 Tax=Solidesulfovibrio sp. DCME TaxID=3447380 RepID=UPI003D13C210
MKREPKHDPSGRHPAARFWRRFFFVLFSSFRFFVNAALLERPLVIGFAWAAVYGDLDLTLKLCLFYELFWLDGIPAGTHIPPNAAAATLAGLSLMHVFQLTSPAEALFVAATTALLGRLFAALEGVQRVVENIVLSRYTAARERTKAPFSPGRLIRRAFYDMVILNGMAFSVALAGLVALYYVVLPKVWPYLSSSGASWSQLWILGSLGGVLSLRYRPAYMVLAGGMGLTMLWFLL